MAFRRIEICGEPGHYISGAAAMRMIELKLASITDDNKLRVKRGGFAELERERTRVHWSSYSDRPAVANRTGNTFLRGYLMNGAAINRSEPCA